MLQGFPYPFPGGTTVGIKGKDSVALASEKRVTFGHYVVSKSARKVFKVTDTVGAASAGMISDMQVLIRDASAVARLYSLEQGSRPTVRTVAKILSNYLFSSKLFPYYVDTIVGGVDVEGPHIIVLDPLGSLIEDDYAVVGSGAEVAIGVVESNYSPNMGPKEIYDLAVKSVRSSISRDAASGNGIDIMVLTGEGVVTNETIHL